MLAHFRNFVAIMDHHGVSKAAAAIGLSQPALSRSLQTLEGRLDARLLERGRGNPILTEVGRFLLPRARTMLSEQNAILDDVEALKSQIGTVAYVNCTPAVALTLLTETILEVSRTHPNLRISIHGDNGTNSEWRTAALRAGEIDVALSHAVPITIEEGFIHEPLIQQEMRIVAAPGNGIDNLTDLADLLDRRWIVAPKSSSGRIVVENEFSLRGLPFPLDVVEVSDWTMGLILASQTSAILTIPYHPVCCRDLMGLTILPIKFRTQPPPVHLIYRRQVSERPAASAFISTVKAIVARL